MGDVFLAIASGPHGFSKLCVLKTLRAQLEDEGGGVAAVQSFLDEGRLAALLNHPNVVQTYEVVQEGDRPVIVMEYLEGQSLHNVLRRARATPSLAPAPPTFVRALCDALEGLHYAHERRGYDGTPLNLVHRDFSPHNVFITFEGQVKLLDFGIAKAAMNSVSTTQGLIKGKVRYIAPEQAFGRPVDRRVDVFSAGVVLWELVTGRRFWGELNDMQVLHALNVGEAPAAAEAEAGADPGLVAIARRALSFDPARRFASAQEMQAALEEQLRQAGAPESSPRALGRQVGQLFERERAEVQATIERQLRLIRATPAAAYEVAAPEAVPSLLHAIVPDTSPSMPPVSEGSVGPAPEPSRPAAKGLGGPPWAWGGLAAALFLGGVVVAFTQVRGRGGPAEGGVGVESRAAAPQPREGERAPDADVERAWEHEAAGAASRAAEPDAAASEGAKDSPEGPAREAAKHGGKAPKSAPPAPPAPPAAARRRGDEPPHAGPRASAAAPVAPVAKEKAPPPPGVRADCSNPFYIDDRGIKTLRPECR